MAKKKNIELTTELAAALKAFAERYGDRWRDVLAEYHAGRPRHDDFIAPMRVIRNTITPNPALLPDLREGR